MCNAMRTLHKLLVTVQVPVFACACVLAVGCSGVYRGATFVDPSDLPRGRLVTTFARTACSGEGAGAQTVYVDFVRRDGGGAFIVERSEPDSWLLVTNSRRQGNTLIFQVVRKSDPPELREYRFPKGGTQPGQYFRSDRYEKPRGSRHRFHSRPLGATTSCRLLPVDPLTGAPLGTYGSEPGASGAAGALGWSFDGTSFRVGDRVLVDVGGRLVPAEILQAPGDKYFVRFEDDADQAGVWIEPARITGRLE